MLRTYSNPAGITWQLPLFFPGVHHPAPVWWFVDDPEAFTPAAVRALARAILAQALRDAASRGKARAAEREDARSWLLSDGVIYAHLLGMRINQADMLAWAEKGYPPGDGRLRNGRKPKTADSHNGYTLQKNVG